MDIQAKLDQVTMVNLAMMGINQKTLPSRHWIRPSADMMQALPLGRWGFPQYWMFTNEVGGSTPYSCATGGAFNHCPGSQPFIYVGNTVRGPPLNIQGGGGWSFRRGQIIYFNPARRRAESFKFYYMFI